MSLIYSSKPLLSQACRLGSIARLITGLQTNLTGTLNCLEFARRRVGNFMFLSTSRVYSIAPLKQINLIDDPMRFEISDTQNLPGITTKGISEDFPTNLPRSLYGATKLASELI